VVVVVVVVGVVVVLADEEEEDAWLSSGNVGKGTLKKEEVGQSHSAVKAEEEAPTEVPPTRCSTALEGLQVSVRQSLGRQVVGTVRSGNRGEP
jgi:hypothetical protein